MRVSKRWRLALSLATLWGCTRAQAGVTYTVTQRDLTAATAARPVTYYAQDHTIRVGGRKVGTRICRIWEEREGCTAPLPARPSQRALAARIGLSA